MEGGTKMKKGTTHPSDTLSYQDKNTIFFDSQLERVYQSFYESPQTMKEVDKSIGIMRESICRYCAKLRKQEKLYPIRKRLCHVTQHPAIEWTCNPALIPIRPEQLSLFGKECVK